ncbi:uncharacterized protein [Procambarus clarkii]|uniref:uncharacterized protein n=1 Tax=Procambarus clarkii TaxID=6728 RepID=UPI0037435A07
MAARPLVVRVRVQVPDDPKLNVPFSCTQVEDLYTLQCVLEMLKEAVEEDGGAPGGGGDDDDGSDVSGYHSDSDSAIMMSGNSPYVTKHARFNFLTRSVRDRARVGQRSSLPFTTACHVSASSRVSTGSSDTQSQGSGVGDPKSDSPTPEGSRKSGEASCASSCASASSSSSSSGVASGVRCGKGHELPVAPGARESAALRQEVETLRAEVTKARQTILHMQEREKRLKERLGDRASRGVERGNGRVENLSLGERRPSALVRRYGNLYAQARVDTLDALDALPDLRNAEELKSKLLFSVVVLAFRSASTSAQALREEVRRVLQIPPPPPLPAGEAHHDHLAYDEHAHALELGVSAFVTANIDKHDLTKNVEEVCQQIWATLYDYPALKTCEGLLQYIKDCVRLAWGLNNQTPPYLIDYETRTYRKEYHVRFHTADPESDGIKTYLWPALLEGRGGPCVQKGVVVT